MRKALTICIQILLGGLLFALNAQIKSQQDSIVDVTRVVSDSSIVAFENDRVNKRIDKEPKRSSKKEKVVESSDSTIFNKPEFKPNPTKAVLYSAVFPGLGQIYNQKYWKLPIVYGGFVGLAYAISWNSGMYNDYSQAYKDVASGTGDSWKDLVRDPNAYEGSSKDALIPQFKRKRDFFRRNRDLAIICTVGLYALCMIDAYVDAQLYDFDISPDLSMRVEPVMFEPTFNYKRTFGLQCSIVF